MFGWFRKKVAPPPTEGVSPSVEPPLVLEPQTAPPFNTSVETPKMVAPPPLPPTVPTPPPSSGEDWEALIESPAEAPRSAPARDSGRVSSASTPTPVPKPAAPPLGDSGPDLLVAGALMRAIPEKQPATPRGWNVRVLKTDAEGIWVVRVPSEADPLPVAAKEVLSLVIFDERKQISYDCPVLRVKAGNPEQILVGRPMKFQQEKSKLDSLGGRQHFRIETQLPVEVKLTGMAGRNMPALSGHTRDISRGGVCLILNRDFDIGRELEVRVLSWNFPLQIKAKVVRCEDEGHGRYSVAVVFPEDMSAITRDLVGHFIMENQRGR